MVQRQQSQRPLGQQGQGGGGWHPPSRAVLERILAQDDYAEELVRVAKEVGEQLARRFRLRSAQARKFYSEVRRIAMDVQYREDQADKARAFRELTLLRPKLAYQARREIQGGEELQRVLDPAIELVGTDAERLRRLAEFFEAILAYHKFYGGE